MRGSTGVGSGGDGRGTGDGGRGDSIIGSEGKGPLNVNGCLPPSCIGDSDGRGTRNTGDGGGGEGRETLNGGCSDLVVEDRGVGGSITLGGGGGGGDSVAGNTETEGVGSKPGEVLKRLRKNKARLNTCVGSTSTAEVGAGEGAIVVL